jgi:hypothetical protein
MNQRDKELAKQAWTENDWEGHVDLKKFAALTRADEREACAKMFDEVMSLVPFAQNDQGGCLTCGFTPKLAAKAIRARGNT